MTKSTAMRAAFAIMIFVLGSLQAWDSGVPQAGLLLVLVVSLAIALPPVALLIPLSQPYFLGAFVLSFLLLVLARVTSPVPLPGLFIILVPAALGLIFGGIVEREGSATL